MSAGELLKQANQLKRSGKLEEAIALYREALELNPNFAWTYYELGDALAKLGQIEEAMISYRHSFDLSPKSPIFQKALDQYSSFQIAYGKSDFTKTSKINGDIVSSQKHHAIISGTGRAGTTFLVQLLTYLGLDTGFEDTNSHVFKNCHAGMEKNIFSEDAPYIIKSPWLCDHIDEILESKKYVIDCAYIPIRDLFSASASRIYVHQNSGN
ncbi:Tetratricopeptide TPR_2 repeat protein [Limnospira maxima CS-328]|uniref:Tetratricopeptide TPR_2 repeat protein n=3 Tax=Limnospira TaxID=2596745 RepID=B5W6F4_LIMMA|nr:Tetratricopeptide TPR_2 repeat protein [Limnospira maxima CS-328]MDC0839335.1 tetratricopeptide repeat protein [Limnoraphis robusta]